MRPREKIAPVQLGHEPQKQDCLVVDALDRPQILRRGLEDRGKIREELRQLPGLLRRVSPGMAQEQLEQLGVRHAVRAARQKSTGQSVHGLIPFPDTA